MSHESVSLSSRALADYYTACLYTLGTRWSWTTLFLYCLLRCKTLVSVRIQQVPPSLQVGEIRATYATAVSICGSSEVPNPRFTGTESTVAATPDSVEKPMHPVQGNKTSMYATIPDLIVRCKSSSESHPSACLWLLVGQQRSAQLALVYLLARILNKHAVQPGPDSASQLSDCTIHRLRGTRLLGLFSNNDVFFL
jgi:hypothetical protein